jgi:hypothetical protein
MKRLAGILSWFWLLSLGGVRAEVPTYNEDVAPILWKINASEPFDVPANGADVYRCFVIPIPIDTNKTVAAFEFRPGNRKVVHHALLYLNTTGAARQLDESEPGPGYASFGGPGILPTGGLGDWAPGALPRMLADGMGKFLRTCIALAPK